MGKMWIHAEVRMEGFIEVDWPNGMSQDEVCVEQMGDHIDLSYWLTLLNKVGIVSFGVTPAERKQAEDFQERLAILTKPHNPADFVERKRPERK